MKRLIVLALMALLSSAIYAQGDELLGYVPANVDGFACLNLKELASHPKIREAIDKNEDQNIVKLREDLKANGIDIYTACTSGIAFFNATTKKGGAVFKTSITEDKFNKVNDSRFQDGSVKKTLFEGKTVYVFESGKDKTAITYLKPDTIGISELPDEVVKLGSLNPSETVSSNAKLMEFSTKADKKSPVWAVFATKIDSPKEGKDPMQQMIPFDNIQGGAFNLNFSGETKDTANLMLNLSCKDKSKAQILTIQLQAMVLAMIPNITQGNQQMSDEFMKALKFSNKDKDIVVNADITPSLQEELKKFAESNAANVLSGQFPSPTLKKKKKKAESASTTTNEPGIPPQPKAQQ